MVQSWGLQGAAAGTDGRWSIHLAHWEFWLLGAPRGAAKPPPPRGAPCKAKQGSSMAEVLPMPAQ